MNKFHIDPDITLAETPPSEFYTSDEYYSLCKEKIFSKSWQMIADTDNVKIMNQVYPVTMLDGCINEPILLTRDDSDNINCISNVCTHRGNIVAESPAILKQLKCRYHGRRFDLDGKFKFMPEFEDCKNFPCEKDDLKKINMDTFGNFIFASLAPAFEFNSLIKDMKDKLKDFQFEHLKYDPLTSKDYLVKANWALYCDNYLEGFHIPYVHSGLNDVIDYNNYTGELYEYSNLQKASGKRNTEVFSKDILPGDPDTAALYYWIFPNMMFNFYPWGLSINIVNPLGAKLTKVRFLTYMLDDSKLENSAGESLDKVEREDEEIIEAVQKGLASRIYQRGRYSPKREIGTHHFHRLLEKHLFS
ncbi:SRPBCC family protein [soil metagenome]